MKTSHCSTSTTTPTVNVVKPNLLPTKCNSDVMPMTHMLPFQSHRLPLASVCSVHKVSPQQLSCSDNSSRLLVFYSKGFIYFMNLVCLYVHFPQLLKLPAQGLIWVPMLDILISKDCYLYDSVLELGLICGCLG